MARSTPLITRLPALLLIGAAALITIEAQRPTALAILLVVVGVLISWSLMLANQWERAVILRLGRLHAIRGPGLFWLIPLVDRVNDWIDMRIQTTDFNAERALTKDTVPVGVDAIVFWQVHDAGRAAMEITDYRSAVARVSQTSLREMIGDAELSQLLSNRKIADEKLKTDIAAKTSGWGVSIISVEIRDVSIPSALEDAMSRQAQAEREKQARIVLASAEEEVARRFVLAAEHFVGHPAALQLRSMNLIYEMTKERGTTILLPSAMVDSMSAAGIVNLAALGTATAPKS
jgi:regulator of protease activity HflC (stomatin/prohibitin superfamily)